MNPLTQEAFGSIFRWVLAIGAGYLVKAGIWTDADATNYVAAGAIALVALGWSFYQKYASRLKILTALAMPAGSTESAVESVISQGEAPPVATPKTVSPKLLLWLLMIAVGVSACGKRYDAEPASFEGRVAVKGIEAVSAGNLAITGIEGLVNANVLPKPEGIRALEFLQIANTGLKELHGVLVVIDDGKDATGSNHQKAFEIARKIISQLAQVPVPVSVEATRDKITGILEQVRSAVLAIIASLNPPQARVSEVLAWNS